MILGISASGTTPYVITALEYAKKIGSSTGVTDTTNKGIYVKGDGQFIITSGSSDYIKAGSSGLEIVTQNLENQHLKNMLKLEKNGIT